MNGLSKFVSMNLKQVVSQTFFLMSYFGRILQMVSYVMWSEVKVILSMVTENFVLYPVQSRRLWKPTRVKIRGILTLVGFRSFCLSSSYYYLFFFFWEGGVGAVGPVCLLKTSFTACLKHLNLHLTWMGTENGILQISNRQTDCYLFCRIRSYFGTGLGLPSQRSELSYQKSTLAKIFTDKNE